MKLTQRMILSGVVAVLLLIAAPANAAVRAVNCDEGDSLQAAIDAGAGSAKFIEIELSGNCEEDISISRDGVTIIGDDNATITGLVRLFSADNIYLENVKLTGPSDGLRVVNGRARLRNVHIVGNDDSGVFVSQGGAVSLFGCIVENNGNDGIILNNASSRIRFTTVQDNGANGILVINNGSLVFDSGDINYHENGNGIHAVNGASINVAETHIGWNNPSGIVLNLGSSGMVDGSYANANAQVGVVLQGNSSLEMNGGMMSWNGLYGAHIRAHSMLTVEDILIEGNAAHGVVVETDSALFALGQSYIQYNTPGDMVQIECRDKESSIAIDGSVVIYPPAVNCPDPDF